MMIGVFVCCALRFCVIWVMCVCVYSYRITHVVWCVLGYLGVVERISNVMRLVLMYGVLKCVLPLYAVGMYICV